MNYRFLTSLLLLTLLIGHQAYAEKASPHLPFASELSSPIKHYNRATPRLATSGTPSQGAYKELAEKGVGTFIDLRNKPKITEQARQEAEAAGAQYHNIPVFGSEGISETQVKMFASIYEKTEGLVLVNCGSGNRVGALWAAYQLSRGVSYEDAVAEGQTAGLKKTLLQNVTSRFCKDC